jgi:preprotein translocase subunit SecG
MLAFRAMLALLIVFQSIVCGLLIFLVLLHSGRDAGLSGAFGVGSTSGSYGGSSAIVEKNLDRITVVVAVLLFVSTYLLSRAY